VATLHARCTEGETVKRPDFRRHAGQLSLTTWNSTLGKIVIHSPFVCNRQRISNFESLLSQFYRHRKGIKSPAELKMTSWSPWTLDITRSSQDNDQWHVYRVEVLRGEYTSNYDQKAYSRSQFPKYADISPAKSIELSFSDMFQFTAVNCATKLAGANPIFRW
jgi:hypothetical protein